MKIVFILIIFIFSPFLSKGQYYSTYTTSTYISGVRVHYTSPSSVIYVKTYPRYFTSPYWGSLASNPYHIYVADTHIAETEYLKNLVSERDSLVKESQRKWEEAMGITREDKKEN